MNEREIYCVGILLGVMGLAGRKPGFWDRVGKVRCMVWCGL